MASTKLVLRNGTSKGDIHEAYGNPIRNYCDIFKRIVTKYKMLVPKY
jgi:hypothetical protein